MSIMRRAAGDLDASETEETLCMARLEASRPTSDGDDGVIVELRLCKWVDDACGPDEDSQYSVDVASCTEHFHPSSKKGQWWAEYAAAGAAVPAVVALAVLAKRWRRASRRGGGKGESGNEWGGWTMSNLA